MIINCKTELRVLSKYSKVATNGKTYFHLVCAGDNGDYCDLGCSPEVFNQVIDGKAYTMGFGINPFYLRKEYSTNINITSVSEAVSINTKKGA